MENIYDIMYYIWNLTIKRTHGKRTIESSVCSIVELHFFFSLASLNSCYSQNYICVHHSKKVNTKKHNTVAVFSVVEGQLSKSPERASVGSWSPSGF